MTEAPSFFIYDFESFGVDPKSDRPAQFAGIRTDMDFNPIGDPVMFYCKQTNDYLPSPESVMITGITPQKCNLEGLSEPEFAKCIWQEFSKPNTCIMGYNNLRFDDVMTQHLFFRNLLPAYDWQFKNQNSRWDLIDLLRACHALRPEGIEWVYDDDGLPNFRLELLTQANGIEHLNAHDAMSDVYATMAMAKLIKEKQPKLFNFYFNYRNKHAVKDKFINTAMLEPVVHVSGMFGNLRNNISVVSPIAWHEKDSNKVITCDLMGDVEAMLNRSSEENRTYLFTKKDELLAEGISPVPLKGISINKCPFLAPMNVLSEEDKIRLNLDMAKINHHLDLLRKTENIRDFVIDINGKEEEFTKDPNANVETTLFDGFFPASDNNHFSVLSHTPVEEWKNLDYAFKDARGEKLKFHYQARHFYPTLSRAEQVKWQKYRRAKLERDAENFERAFQQCLALHAQDEEKLKLLAELQQYVATLFQ